MPGTKEIRVKIKSVQNTRKITKAMEMVAASKMRKAQERMRAARPYGEKIRNVAAHISHANPEYRHPFLVPRDTVKRVGLIVITTDVNRQRKRLRRCDVSVDTQDRRCPLHPPLRGHTHADGTAGRERRASRHDADGRKIAAHLPRE